MRHTAFSPRAFASTRLVVLAMLLGSAVCEVPNFNDKEEGGTEAGEREVSDTAETVNRGSEAD
jgi:hypothetical protein